MSIGNGNGSESESESVKKTSDKLSVCNGKRKFECRFRKIHSYMASIKQRKKAKVKPDKNCS